MNKEQILTADILDIIFVNKNKAYGAYQLRKTYNQRILKSLVITIVLFITLCSFFLKKPSNNLIVNKIKDSIVLTSIDDKERLKEIPPPPVKKDLIKVQSKKFTEIVIKKDVEVISTPPTQAELTDNKIDVVDNEGVKYDNITELVDIDKGKEIIEQPKPAEPEIFEKVEIEASFIGGDRKWIQYLQRTINSETPTYNNAPEGTYTIIIKFIVDSDGNISDLTPLTNYGYGMEDEAIRVIKKAPKWLPAIQNGRKVKAYRKQPITFRVKID